MALRQDSRILRLHTPQGADRLFAVSLRAREAVSSLFEFSISCFSVESPIKIEDLIGKPIVVSVNPGAQPERHFHGYAWNVDFVGQDQVNGRFMYIIHAAPWLWFLDQKIDSRIFQDKDLTEIAEIIFEEFGFADYDWKLDKTPQKRTYCVQYAESCFAFLSRLFEEEGVFYFFRHERDRHRLVLGRGRAAVEAIGALPYRRLEAGDAGAAISDLREEFELRPGRVALNDFNFETPALDLTVGLGTRIANAATGDLEVFEHPGRYATRDEGESMARLRMEAHESLYRVSEGASNATTLYPGGAFQLEEPPAGVSSSSLLVTTLEHEAENNWDEDLSGGASYTTKFEAIPDEQVFRPPVRTPRPRVEGPQTAFVTGPDAEEIHTDKYGRVKVQFHWDRRGPGDETSSCYIRVAQSWSGRNYGFIAIPRVGMEVVVEFLDGDPDRPLVTGAVYNADNMPPHQLDENKTRTTLKTSSSLGGDGFNELWFEDKKSEEQVFLHAQKDLDIRIRNAERVFVGDSSHKTIEKNENSKIGGDQSLTVEGDQKARVEGDASLSVTGDHDVEVSGSYAVDVKGETVIKSMRPITLQCGATFIKLTPAMAYIQSPMVMINSGGAASGKRASPAAPDAPAEAQRAGEGRVPDAPRARRLEPIEGDREAVAALQAASAEVASMKSGARNGAFFRTPCGG